MQVALLGKGAFGSTAKRLLCYCCYDSRSITYCLVNSWNFVERVLTELIVGGIKLEKYFKSCDVRPKY